jgi:predicted dienelactone hydrolase
MKRGIAVLLSLCVLLGVAYFTASKWAIRHETMTFYDATRDNRPVAVDIAVRRDKEMQASAGIITLPVAILNHGNTVKFTEYSFLANVFAARGYLAMSIQHDLPTDAPLVTNVGELYVGRLPQYHRGVANIRFAVDEMKKVVPNADYDHLTMVGHSNGGDISMYFAKMYPDHI